MITIRCRNWEAEPEICHLDCGIDVTEAEANSTAWVGIVLATSPEWFVVLRTCPEHGSHTDPFCSLGCFTRYHQRHPHGA